MLKGFGDGGDGVAVLVDQRSDDAGLVDGAGGLRRRVRREHRGLDGGAGGGLGDGGDVLAALAVDPVRQTLEAVDEFVETVGKFDDAQRHRRERRRGGGALAAQRREPRADTGDGDQIDAAHGFEGGSASS